MTYRKKLIEVALPLEAINRGCEEDKNRKTGHIRNLHKWFAPMPLPAWRAMLFAALVDDPADSFPEHAVAGERERLLHLVERLSSFEAYKDAALLTEVRAEVARAVKGAEPTIVDPFCGGGSTLLEAQRLGLPTRGSDLNQVPVLITTVLCRVPALFSHVAPVNPAHAPALFSDERRLAGFKADVAYYAGRIRDAAWQVLSPYYPPSNGATPYAYRWAWTVASPEPAAQRRHTPLVSNWSMSRHTKHRAWVDSIRTGEGIEFVVRTEGTPRPATTARVGATCLHSNVPIPLEYIRAEGRAGKVTVQVGS